ncbi:glyoxalase superfamily protein [Pseudomonas sp. 2835]|uniref:glyoxalase superfamily protein n=1 Tax=Pseudomonas sp. 2835 TaxID=3156451 RepID=UPI003D242697
MTLVEPAPAKSTALRSSVYYRPQAYAASRSRPHGLGFRRKTMISTEQAKPTAVRFDKPIPILRSFDEAKAREFYLDFLGFSVEFEHRFEADLPLYLGISRDGLQLHLSEHHGDASPGATIFVPTHNIEQLRDELQAKRYGYGRPDIVEQGWGKVLEVYDPFGNRIRFCQS